MAERPATVAVVGHGPSPQGQGWGAAIDRCDAVVRMWDCHWQAASDYGTRYDFGLFTAWPRDLALLRRFVRRAPGAWWAYDIRGRLGALKDAPAALRFDPAPHVALLRAAGARGARGRIELSRGGAALLATLEFLRPRTLHLVGFDGLRDGDFPLDRHPAGFSQALALMGRRVDTRFFGRVTATHDPAAERALIERAAAAQGCALAWGFDLPVREAA
jgi:hypothetical protein